MGANVIALPIELGRIVGREEDIQQIVVGDSVGIEGHADRLGMTCVTAANLLVRRIDDIAADVSAFDGLHSYDVVEYGFGAPEAPACENSDFLSHDRSFQWSGSNRRPQSLW